MGGLHFAVTADNTDFINKMNEVRESVKESSGVISKLGKDFDVSTPEAKIDALNKAIRANEELMISSSQKLEKWEQDAKDAFTAGDMDLFNTITEDITNLQGVLSEAMEETKSYYEALSLLQAPDMTMPEVRAPQLFSSQADYDYVEGLKEKIVDLQLQIAQFDGTDEALQPLRQELSDTQQLLMAAEHQAASAAAALGEDLGGRAAEASTRLYALNNAVAEQSATVEELKGRVAEAAAALEALNGSENTDAIDSARMRYDQLNASLNNAQNQLLNLQAAQADANSNWTQTNMEVQQHDSVMVKMLGGYDKYKTIIGQLPGPVQQVVGGIQGMTGAAKAFIATPLGAIIAAIVLALQALKSWFDSSSEGQMAFAKISGYVSGVLGQLKEIVLAVGKAIYNAFSDPKKAVSDLWEAIKTNIVNRFTALGQLAAHVGEMISAAFDPDKSVGEAWDKIQDDVLQLTTGVENLRQKVKAYGKEIDDVGRKNSTLNAREEQLHRDRSKWQIQEKKLDAEIAEARNKAMKGDAKASKEAQKLIEEKYAKQKEFATEELNIIKERNALTTNKQEDYDAEYAAEARLEELKAQELQEKRYFDRRNMMMDRQAETAEQKARRQAEARKKLAEELEALERENSNNLLALQEESAEKALKLIEADYNDRIAATKKKAREWAKANREAAVTGVGENGLTTQQSEAIQEAEKAAQETRKKQVQELYRTEAAAMRDYLKQYGTYQQQKLAIAEEYAEKIRKATTEGERLSLMKERDAAVRKVDVDAINQQIDWQAVFGGFTGLLEQQLRETLAGLKEYTKSDKFKASSAEDKKLVFEAIERIQQQLPGDHSGTLNFAAIKKQMDAFAQALNEAQAAARADVMAQNNLAAAQRRYNEAIKSGDKAEIESAKLHLEMTKSVAAATASTLQEANSTVESLGSDLRKSADETVAGLDMVASGLQGFASGTLSGAFAGLQNTLTGLSKLNLGDKLNQAVGSLSETLSSAGFIGQIISAILSILDILKDGIGPLIASLIDTIFNAVTGILDNILSGDFAVQIGKSLRDGIGGILNTITFGGFSSWLSSSNAKEVAETTAKLTARNEMLCKSIDALKDEMSKARGIDTVRTYDKVYAAQQELIANTAGVLAAQMGYHGAHHSNNSYINDAMSRADWQRISQMVDQRVTSASDLWRLTPEQLKKLQGDPEIWTKIYTSGKYDKTEYLDQYLELADSLSELTDQLNETLTQISFDSMYDNFVDKLMDMDAKAEDIAGNVSEYFMRAMLSNKVGQLYADRLEAWYKKFADGMRDGALEASERQALTDEYTAMVNEAIALRNQLAAATGYDKTASSYQQGSTGGYSTQLSEDTGSEIVGRATALQDAAYVRNELLTLIQSDAASIRGMIAARTEMLEDLQEGFCVRVIEQLEIIAKNTKDLGSIKGYVEEIKNLIKDL